MSKILKRLLVCPFVFGLLSITHIFFIFKRTYMFLKYGGEFINYKIDEQKTIHDIYKKQKETHLYLVKKYGEI